MRFLGLSLGDRVPDAKTIWLYRDTLTQKNVIEELFSLFNRQLESQGIITHTGTIVDATFVDAPRQRNTREENKTIKAGDIPEEWAENTPEAAHKLAQKDTDARWAVKNKEKHYGYKDHTKVDADSKIITDYAVTNAAVHDSNEFVDFIDGTDKVVFADSAYAGREIAEKLPKNVENSIHEKGYRNRPLTDEQKESNRNKSKIRARIEHVYGYMTGSMKGITVRSIGSQRAGFNIGLTNLVYNLCRYSILKRQRLSVG
jgi:IS5 family transposase